MAKYELTQERLREIPPPPEPGAVERRGDWVIISKDALDKRCVCRCSRCQHVTMIGREALESGEVIFCGGCVAPRNNPAPASQGRSFSKQVAEEATKGARKRHWSVS